MLCFDFKRLLYNFVIVPSNALIILFVFPNRLVCRIYETKFSTHVSLLARSLRSPCVNKCGSDEELASHVGSQSTLFPSWCQWSSSESETSSLKVKIFRGALVQGILHFVEQASLQLASLDISLCVWIWKWCLLCWLNKSNNRMSGLLVPSKPWERWTAFGANHLPILRETLYTLHNKYEGPNFYLGHPLCPKIKLVTFLNERGKISPRIWRTVHHTRNRRHQDNLNTSLERRKYNKHNPVTQNTSQQEHAQHLQLIITMSGTPLVVQCSSSTAYC